VQMVVRNAQLAPDGDDVLDVPDGLDDVSADLVVSGRPDTSRCPLDGYLKAVRVHQEALQDHAVGHFAADLLVWRAEDAEHIGLADDPGQQVVLVTRAQQLPYRRLLGECQAEDFFGCRDCPPKLVPSRRRHLRS
jgi:hypothetical protein